MRSRLGNNFGIKDLKVRAVHCLNGQRCPTAKEIREPKLTPLWGKAATHLPYDRCRVAFMNDI